MADASYKQFCPVAMAAEILCSRWTLLLLRELTAGSTRFNDLRRGLPRMSPALLSKRLKDLQAAGIVDRIPLPNDPEVFEYRLTASGRELAPVIESVGAWGHRWISTESSLDNLDVNLLMWDIRRNIDLTPLPERRSTIQFIFEDQPQSRRNWWLLAQPDQGVDLCSVDPGLDVDLYIVSSLRAMTEIWMGYITVARAKDDGRLVVTGNADLGGKLEIWLALSPFARGARLVA